MRTIKFRGKRTDESKYAGEWNEGGCIQCEESDDVLIISASTDHCTFTCHVIPETVGQFTGLFDKNGKEIYEGDIVSVRVSNNRFKKNPRFEKDVIIFEGGRFRCKNNYIYHLENRIEVIGNIYDNPELLEGGPQ